MGAHNRVLMFTESTAIMYLSGCCSGLDSQRYSIIRELVVSQPPRYLFIRGLLTAFQMCKMLEMWACLYKVFL